MTRHRHRRRILVVVVSALAMLVGMGALLNLPEAGVLAPARAAPVQNPPDVQQVDPGTVINTADAFITVSGADFVRVLSGTEVISMPKILLNEAPLPGVGWVSSATLTSTVPAGYPVGTYAVTVQNPDGLSDTLVSALTVRYPTPDVTAFDPVSGTFGQPLTLVITGTDFVSPTNVILGLSHDLDVGYVSSTTLTATLPSALTPGVGILTPGVYDLTVENPGPGRVVDFIADAFTLYSPVPTVSEVDPQKTYNDMDTPIVISGTNFAPTPQVVLGSTPLEHVTWISLTQLTAEVPWGMEPGTYPLTVTNPTPGGYAVQFSEALTMAEGFNTWTTGGPYGGRIQELVHHPLISTTLYATVMNVGVFASTDGAESWEMILRQDWLTRLTFDAQDPDVMYVGGDGGLLRTTDGGANWVEIPPPRESMVPVYNLYRPLAHPTDTCVVYLGKRTPDEPDVEPGGVYRSDNCGDTWVRWGGEDSGLTDTHVVDLAFLPDDAGTIIAGTQNGNVFRSDDAGANWSWQAHVEPGIEKIAFNPFKAYEAWIMTNGPNSVYEPPFVYTSTNLTAWTPVTVTDGGGNSYPVHDLVFLSADTIWAAMSYGVVSTDGGATWSDTGWDGVFAWDDVRAFAMDPDLPNVVYAGHNIGGVYKSTDGGVTWQASNEGLAGVIPTSMAVSPDDPDTLYAYTTLGLLKSRNGGQSWQSLEKWVGGVGGEWMLAVDPVTATRIYLGRSCVGAFCIQISEDAGSTWRAISTPLSSELSGYETNVGVIKPQLAEVGHIFAAAGFTSVDSGGERWTYGGIFFSDDHGETWVRLAANEPISAVNEFAYDAVDPNLIYASTQGSGIWRSTTGGSAWQQLSIAGLAPPVGVESMAAHPDRPNVILARVLSFEDTLNASGYLYISQNAGEGWTRLDDDEGTSDDGLVFAPPAAGMSPYMLYTGCGSGACRSMDTGSSWNTIYGVPRPTAMVAATDGERIVIYAASPGGMAAADEPVLNALGRMENVPGRGRVMGSGVYRTTLRPLDQHVYLPLVVRGSLAN
jgi:photosystem II stability/assembly factor-like uncharacterized protein